MKWWKGPSWQLRKAFWNAWVSTVCGERVSLINPEQLSEWVSGQKIGLFWCCTGKQDCQIPGYQQGIERDGCHIQVGKLVEIWGVDPGKDRDHIRVQRLGVHPPKHPCSPGEPMFVICRWAVIPGDSRVPPGGWDVYVQVKSLPSSELYFSRTRKFTTAFFFFWHKGEEGNVLVQVKQN